ncbi:MULTISPECIES: hypothetical protein [unclassified Streptomyces]|uniref:hypothetical protein n=1 Tax=unclassified Streptomyces TaxID=2593676 RepID=UPI002256C060|nr:MULTISPECIES: hypothetical protein [unclassified Streptomyces]MCX5147441.1 hypothetical protein [Streptomyces sp. NBC_00320]WSN50563.1 hypothetical protein OG299_24225 [Streptomyces sp. NBC_01296]WSW59990.1 hypothetical protein OG513_16135 [Streptomyces sp. NBC_00998]
MNDSPGWAVPGPSPSDGERPGASDGRDGAEGGTPPPAGGPKWSAEQPPPGEWSSPGTPQAPKAPQQQPQPGAGWGSYGGPQGPQGGQYGYPGTPGRWGKPPAAKPGVIPLRPLDLGEILDGAVATMRTHWRTVLPITLVVATVVQVISVFVQKYTSADLAVTSGPGSGDSLKDVVDSLGGSMAALLATGFVQLIGTIVATAMLTMIFSRAILGHGSSIGEAWRESRPQLLRLLGLTLLLALGGIVIVLVLLLPGIALGSRGIAVVGGVAALPLLLWLALKFSLASPALMLEKSSVITSLRRSSRLVEGSWWRIFGITALTALITTFVSAIIVGPLTAVGLAIGLADSGVEGLENGTAATGWAALILSAVGAVIAQTVTMPIQSGVTVLLYVDQRIRREALDLELARAAGLENYGQDATAPPTGG